MLAKDLSNSLWATATLAEKSPLGTAGLLANNVQSSSVAGLPWLHISQRVLST